MDSMQYWFGMAIRRNSEDVYKMKRAAFENYDDDYRHGFCPPGKDSRCKYQTDKVTGKQTHKNRINLLRWIHKII